MTALNLVVIDSSGDVDVVAQWAGRISGAWRESIEGIMSVGCLLHEAHEELKFEPGAWARLTGRGKNNPQILPFKWPTAEHLRQIGKDKRIVCYSTQLPMDWKSVYLLTTLGDIDLQRAESDGLITPALTQSKIRSFKRLLRKETELATVRTIKPRYRVNHLAIESITTTDLPDDGVDAIITDPPYPPEFLRTFSDLANLAARTLKPSGWCVVMTGTLYLPEVIAALCSKLTYRWQYIVTTPGGSNARIASLKVFQSYKPVLLFQKLPLTKIREWWPDIIAAKASEQDKSLHPWQQSEPVFAELINRFSLPGGLIVDPFAGSGTTGRAAIANGRHFWGCDADAKCVSQAAE